MYTQKEAIEKVLEIRDKLGHMPTEEEYYKVREIAALDDLKRALKAKNYAAVNIAVLRELRRRRGENPYIARDSDERWCADMIFAPNNNMKRFPEESKKPAKTPKVNDEPRGRKKKWDKKTVAEIAMRFYRRYERFPTGADFCSDGAFKTMEKDTPSCWVLYFNLGEHRSSWLNACAEILKIPPEELPGKAKRANRKKSAEPQEETQNQPHDG